MRRAASAALAFGLMMVLPTLAEAQLFPNATIKRQRVPCCEEPSIYSLYRRQYYGYYPTCWRRFPEGWGCPSPEAPNSAAAIEEIRRDLEREGAADAPGPGAEPGLERDTPAPPPGGGAARPPRGPIPLPGDERSPFEDPEPSTPPAPRAAPPTGPDALPSPFDDLPPPTGAPGANPTAGASALPPLEVPPSMLGESAVNEAAAPAPRRTLLGGALASARGRLRR